MRDLGLLGESDINHPALAHRLGRVLCTHDADYLELARAGEAHSGIIFGQQHKHGIGDWVGFLELVYSVYSAEDMIGRLEYL